MRTKDQRHADTVEHNKQQSEDVILYNEIADDTLERAAAPGQAQMVNPTVPGAIICLPFERR